MVRGPQAGHAARQLAALRRGRQRSHVYYHNYGLGTDLAFYDKQGQIGWPETGDHAKLWTRYGELAKKQGLTWGGDWQKGTDRPHVEYHPGLSASQAANLKAAHRRNGLEGAWDQLGIGQQP